MLQTQTAAGKSSGVSVRLKINTTQKRSICITIYRVDQQPRSRIAEEEPRGRRTMNTAGRKDVSSAVAGKKRCSSNVTCRHAEQRPKVQ